VSLCQIRELTTRCQRLREEAAAGSAAAAEEGRQAAALDARQAQLLGRCEDLARRIRELGSLSAEVFEKYQGKGVKVRRGWARCTASVYRGYGLCLQECVVDHHSRLCSVAFDMCL
jgi:hypothetical protein